MPGKTRAIAKDERVMRPDAYHYFGERPQLKSGCEADIYGQNAAFTLLVSPHQKSELPASKFNRDDRCDQSSRMD